MDLLNSLNSPGSASAIKKQVSEGDPAHQKLRKATRAMESYFVGTLLKKMHESAAKGGLLEENSQTATYREMFDDAVAAEIGKRGAFGLADTLYKEMVVHLDGPARPPAAVAPPKAADPKS